MEPRTEDLLSSDGFTAGAAPEAVAVYAEPLAAGLPAAVELLLTNPSSFPITRMSLAAGGRFVDVSPVRRTIDLPGGGSIVLLLELVPRSPGRVVLELCLWARMSGEACKWVGELPLEAVASSAVGRARSTGTGSARRSIAMRRVPVSGEAISAPAAVTAPAVAPVRVEPVPAPFSFDEAAQALLRAAPTMEEGGGLGGSPAAEPAPGEDLPLLNTANLALSRQESSAARLGLPVRWFSRSGLEFVLVPSGRCMIGAAESDTEARPDEKPLVAFSLPQPVYVSVTPLPASAVGRFVEAFQGQPNAPAGRLVRDRAFACGCRSASASGTRPATEVSHNDALLLLAWLGERDGGLGYRLPTEGEWEYAARAGCGAPAPWGDGRPVPGQAVFAATAPMPVEPREAAARRNAWGVCDAIGNVWEWTASEYRPLAEGCFARAAVGITGSRVARGGSWRDATAPLMRFARRRPLHANARHDDVGLRVVCPIGGDPSAFGKRLAAISRTGS